MRKNPKPFFLVKLTNSAANLRQMAVCFVGDFHKGVVLVLVLVRVLTMVLVLVRVSTAVLVLA